ncbi:MAG: protein translocase subunit SecF, partial [Proteobacteria bacterium]|nr:protein translocase subunit SecF [Pseudomonadota bacterium]
MLIKREIDFMGVRRVAGSISLVLVLVSIVSLAVNSLEFGLDFTSGTSVRLNYSDAIVLGEVNDTLRSNGYADAVVVSFGSDRDIRIILPVDETVAVGDQAAQAAEVGATIVALLGTETASEITLLGSDYVSAKVGGELAEQGGLGMLVALGIIMVYISIRFQFKFAVGAVVALAHDVIITLGIFS